MVGKTFAVTFHPAAENVVTTNAFTDKVHSFTLSIQLHNSIIVTRPSFMVSAICIEDYSSNNILIGWSTKTVPADDRQTVFL